MTCRVLIYAIILSASCLNGQKLTSPCPTLFNYEPQKESDRWYGDVTLIPDSELNGVWLRIELDRPVLQVGNWFGEVEKKNDTVYLIKNPKHKLGPNNPFALRFYVHYDHRSPTPKLTGFLLNAVRKCPEGVELTTASSAVLEFTSNPLGNVAGGNEVVVPTPGPSVITAAPPPFIPPGQNRPQEVQCGTVPVAPRPLITFGEVAKEGELPWHAALYQANGPNLNYVCGGSLINKYFVLTVAHCVTQSRTEYVLNNEVLLVYLGKYYLKRWSNPGVQSKTVAALIPHPDYKADSYLNDIALIKLQEPVTFTDYVRPICLWEGDTSVNAILNKLGVVAGWGKTESSLSSEKLRRANMPVVSKETCIYSNPDFFSRFASDRTFCAGFRNGTAACTGDSGGGMIFPKPGSNPDHPTWQIRGLVSISVATNDERVCDTKHYVIFTDIARYLEWLYTAMKEE